MIKVRLSGGIGNQLFQYYDGARKSIQHNEKLVIDFRNVYLGKTQHSSLITSFTLPVPADFINMNPGYISKVIHKAMLSFKNKISNISRSRDGAQQSLVSPEQNWKNYQFVESKLNTGLKLKSPSPWYLNEVAKIQLEPVIVIHIRRGDYDLPRNRNTIGLLDVSYFAECLKIARNKFGSLPIWVLSDSSSVEEEFKNIFPAETRFIFPPPNTDPAESMLLMSLARILIISNSTFSWWAANLSRESTTVYCPSPWFKNLEQPKDLLIETWNLVGSRWKIYDDK